MADKRDPDSDNESEFGLGEGYIDPVQRANRFVTPEEELVEIRSLPKTFDNSNPERPTQETTPVPRLLPGEKETDRG